MTASQERRQKHRRFSDRRVHVLLRIHEILFDLDAGDERDDAIIEELRLDFETDRAALVTVGAGDSLEVEVDALNGAWNGEVKGSVLSGPGLGELIEAHRLASGAVTLTYTRRPSVFTPGGWERLWAGDLGEAATALLSVAVEPQGAPKRLIWLQQAGYSREWSSHDRDLAEEVASLMSRAADKDRGVG